MNKMKQLIRRLGVEAGMVVAAVVVCVGLMLLTGSFADSAAQRKSKADSDLSQLRGQLNSVRTQLEQSGEAQKRFVDIQLQRTNPDFTSKIDTLRDWMRDAKNRYRFANNFKLSLPQEKPADKPELSGLDYDISTRNDITIELEAMSDLHVFSFLRDLRNGAPGITRITDVSIERRGDLDPATIAQMLGGMSPYLVRAKITFNWVGINPKETDDTAASPAVHSAPGGM